MEERKPPTMGSAGDWGGGALGGQERVDLCLTLLLFFVYESCRKIHCPHRAWPRQVGRFRKPRASTTPPPPTRPFHLDMDSLLDASLSSLHLSPKRSHPLARPDALSRMEKPITGKLLSGNSWLLGFLPCHYFWAQSLATSGVALLPWYRFALQEKQRIFTKLRSNWSQLLFTRSW